MYSLQWVGRSLLSSYCAAAGGKWSVITLWRLAGGDRAGDRAGDRDGGLPQDSLPWLLGLHEPPAWKAGKQTFLVHLMQKEGCSSHTPMAVEKSSHWASEKEAQQCTHVDLATDSSPLPCSASSSDSVVDMLFVVVAFVCGSRYTASPLRFRKVKKKKKKKRTHRPPNEIFAVL